MDKKTFALLCIIALLAGSVFYFWVNYIRVDPVAETKQTGQIIGGIKETAETATGWVMSHDSQVRTEVRVVYEQVRTKVNALSADSVADGLNAELAIFRGMEGGAVGIHDD